MKPLAVFLIAAAVLAAGPGEGRAADVDTLLRDIKRGERDRESRQWGAERAGKRGAREEEPSPRARPFIGNTETKKVHRRECEWADKIVPPRRVYFKTYAEAVRQGYAACKVCTPDSEGPREERPPPAGTPGARTSSPLLGDRVTRKVHRSSCERAKNIHDRNLAGFATWKEAHAAGYVACRKCKPDIANLPRDDDEPLGAPKSTPTPPPAGAFIGHSVSRKAHRAECEWARKISGKNRAYFTTWEEAAAAGYAPCRVCMPDTPSPAPAPGR